MSMPDDLSSLNTVLSGVVVPVGYPAIARIYQSPTEKEVTTAEVPCFVIMWGKEKARVELFTFGTMMETRRYVIRLYYKPVGQGTIHDNLTDIMQYRQATLNALYQHIRLYSTVFGAYPIECGYPQQFPEKWNGDFHIGFDTIITVKEQVTVTLGS